MNYSRFNITGTLPSTGQGFVVNLLSAEADFIPVSQVEAMRAGVLPSDLDGWTAKGYVVDPREEDTRYRQAYLDFLDARDKDEVQIFFVPWYACNFSCSYCFQAEYPPERSPLRAEVVDAFFAQIQRQFGARRKYLTLFGGEPLLPGESHRQAVAEFLQRATQADLEVAVVTNGYTLESYMPILAQARIREIQVTLDGPPPVHDGRRALRGGDPTFETIAGGIDAALAAGHTVNLRMVADRSNLPQLPALAAVARERGWVGHPRFKTQIGRNYELHSCHAAGGRGQLYDRLEFYQELYEISRQHPEVQDFHRPTFSVARFLADNGELPRPLFDACTGTKTEWAFDFAGRIFACTATVGKPGEELGTFWPQVSLDTAAIDVWQERDVFAIEKCRNCSSQLACGGGCAAVAHNVHGSLLAPDCRPVPQTLALGLDLYMGDEAPPAMH